ncbi:hypothetical protein J8273_0518 [Carpediemonas membranifera]|uniref:Uncharacterized protein n=1 Tax=Carpediemonas membranifera TaxID=201153 RepID=A0A8J6E0L8_9EUKA|nr:hypothetical protein J8273_0518 [Carpediemonas membranifera]|eukprot:KAG9395289.1 hypothetical protein J8273_0518 [Carpediemonas membranifera]
MVGTESRAGRVRMRQGDLEHMTVSSLSLLSQYIITRKDYDTTCDVFHEPARFVAKRARAQMEKLTREISLLKMQLKKAKSELQDVHNLSMSLPCSPIPPQSGTLSRTSCPRRATNEPEASIPSSS